MIFKQHAYQTIHCQTNSQSFRLENLRLAQFTGLTSPRIEWPRMLTGQFADWPTRGQSSRRLVNSTTAISR